MRVKICGVTSIRDALSIAELGADMLGFIGEPGTLRFVKPDFLRVVRAGVSKPLVYVRVNGEMRKVFEEGKYADYIQIHRVLSERELEDLMSLEPRKFILYVPANDIGSSYIRKVDNLGLTPLIDSPKRGQKVDPKVLAEKFKGFLSRSGIGGGITPDNVKEYMALDPMFIDVSSGVEELPGKKDLSKVSRMIEVIKGESPKPNFS